MWHTICTLYQWYKLRCFIVAACVLLAILFSYFLVKRKYNNKKITKCDLIIRYFTIYYMIFLLTVTLFIRIPLETHQYNIELLWTIKRYIETLNKVYLYDVINNIMLFVPLALGITYILPCEYKICTIFVCALLSFTIELTQLVTKLGLFQIDDILNNILGVVLFYIIYSLYNNKKKCRCNTMKKAAIVTIYDPNPNYGNKLQNYASVHLLKKIGMSATTLVTEPQHTSWKTRVKLFINGLSRYKLRGKNAQYEWRKAIVFDSFNRKYLNPSDELLKGSFKADSYDYYFVGSDQVWNPAWYDSYEKKKEIFLLDFAEPKQMVCMAPSFSVDSISDEWKPWFAGHLKRFPSISVREEAGARLIKELIGVDASVVIDPTMMIDGSEWKKIALKPKRLKTGMPYLLTYFIGERTLKVQGDINRIAEQHNLIVYNLKDISQPEVYMAGPCEFIYLIENAKLILTDSFHACVFSFLLGKPFMVYPRNGSGENMMSRINTLLNKFDLQRKYVYSGFENDLFECDYKEGYKNLELERKKGMSYLYHAIEMADEC